MSVPLARVGQEFLGAGGGAVVDGDGEAVALDVEREVLAHDRQANDADVALAVTCIRHPVSLRTDSNRPASVAGLLR